MNCVSFGFWSFESDDGAIERWWIPLKIFLRRPSNLLSNVVNDGNVFKSRHATPIRRKRQKKRLVSGNFWSVPFEFLLYKFDCEQPVTTYWRIRGNEFPRRFRERVQSEKNQGETIRYRVGGGLIISASGIRTEFNLNLFFVRTRLPKRRCTTETTKKYSVYLRSVRLGFFQQNRRNDYNWRIWKVEFPRTRKRKKRRRNNVLLSCRSEAAAKWLDDSVWGWVKGSRPLKERNGVQQKLNFRLYLATENVTMENLARTS